MKLSEDSVEQQPEQLASANGLQLCFQCFGQSHNPPLVLIMGLATQMIHWDDVFCQTLADQGFWVIRFDNRDIGLSTKLSGQRPPGVSAFLANQWFKRQLNVPYLLTDMAKDTLALLDFLEISSAHVVGVSMGGMIAQCMAIEAPKRVKSLTSIMSTTGNRQLPKPKPWVTLKVIRPVPKNDADFKEYALDMWRMLHGDYFAFDAERVAKTLLKARARCFYPAGVRRQTAAIVASPDRTSALRQISTPSLVIHGDYDPLVPVQCGQATAASIPDAKLKIYKGMGHTLPKELWVDMIGEICTIAS